MSAIVEVHELLGPDWAQMCRRGGGAVCQEPLSQALKLSAHRSDPSLTSLKETLNQFDHSSPKPEGRGTGERRTILAGNPLKCFSVTSLPDDFVTYDVHPEQINPLGVRISSVLV